MRFMKTNASWAIAMALLLTACQAPPSPLTTGTLVSRQEFSLRVRPVVSDGMRLLAAPPLKTAADVDSLEIHLQAQVGPGQYLPIDAATGEPSAETSSPVKLRVEGPLDPSLSLAFNHLKPETDYRILARAFEGTVQISDDEHSAIDVPVATVQELGTVEVPLRIAAPFGAETQVSLDLWGLHPKISRVQASLSNPAQGVVAQVDVPRASLGSALNLASLRANTTYKLDLTAYEDWNPTPIGTASALIPVATEQSVATRSIPLAIKGEWFLSTGLDYVAVDGAGNIHATIFVTQSSTRLLRYGRDGSTTDITLPFRLYGLDVAPDGTRFVVTEDGRALRLTSDAGAYEVLVNAGSYGLDVDEAGNCYATADWDKVYKFAPGSTTGELVSSGLYSGHAVFAAPGGALYIETHGASQNFYRRSAPNAPAELLWSGSGNWARGMVMRSDGKILTPVEMSGLWEIDPTTGARTLIMPYPQVHRGLAQDVKGNLYVTGNGFLRVF